MRFFSYYILLFIFFSCSQGSPEKNTKTNFLFTKIPVATSNVDFSNKVVETLSFNFLNYPYIYNGGGVAIIDINKDGFDDIYFTSNQHSNKLYLNKGNFTFEDITKKANVEDTKGWTTGVSVVDINQDSWPDIYVCKSGSLRNSAQRKNKLYINNQNGTFTESAKKYKLDHPGFSTQAYFFDSDLDGDLDMYLVNHRPDFKNNAIIEKEPTKIIEMSDQFFENIDGTFENVTEKSGIKNSAWGLSASIGDFNEDGYPDVFVANDFLQPDYLYINNKNGTFTESAKTYFNHISANSMGSDYADINNDLLPDLIVLDMIAADHKRSKKNMATMSTDNFNELVASGYHYQYMANMLQLNRGATHFSEIGQLAGISKTDWSWAPLIADFNNDGFKDVFITNGIENDLSNQDFRTQLKNNIQNKKKVSLQEAIKMMPSEKLHNYLYVNSQNLLFSDQSKQAGLEEKINSNGAAYADLDNDGDLDLVVNNQNENAFIYKNNSQNNYIKVSLNGPSKNQNALGAKVILYQKNQQQLLTQNTSRGYQSSISSTLNFGIGDIKSVDSIQVVWPDKTTETQYQIAANQWIQFNYTIKAKQYKKPEVKNVFKEISSTELGIDYRHFENNFNDYSLQLLLPQKQSTQSRAIAVGDVNNDSLQDLFLGNGFGKPGVIFLQNNNGKFSKLSNPIFQKHAKYEDQNAVFFDADGDSDLDLIVSSGGYELKENSPLLQDRIYFNNGHGRFSAGKLPKMLSSTKSITVADIDQDDDLDIFIGGRVIPGKYPMAPDSFLLLNNNGVFTDITDSIAKELRNFGMINQSIFSDFDNDGDQDLILAAEWQSITIFENNHGHFKKLALPALDKNKGWYQSIKGFDYDGDGDQDYFIGNLGLNNKFHANPKKPLHIYADYFDNNSSFDIILSKTLNGNLVPVRGKQCSTEQTPFLGKKIATYNQFANATLDQIYGKEKLEKAYHLYTNTFASVFLENQGNKNFKEIKLPNNCQFGPTLAFLIQKNKKNQLMDIIGVGNIYEAEVETIRYDASKGFILNSDNKELKSESTSFFPTNKNTKAIKQIEIQGIPHFILFNNNDRLSVFKYQE